MPESTSIDTTQNIPYTVTLDEDGEDLILPLPDEIMDQLEWYDGDVLEWLVNEEDKTVIIRKVEE
jgi:bifunctional DNA-binding transcriptional regulator/antitoxin component of YhaV-PrlF toxin-antitoxin module